MFRIFVFALLLLPGASNAQGSLRGTGNDSCGSYLAANTGLPFAKSKKMKIQGDDFFDKSFVYSEWIQGYLTAMSTMIDTTKASRTDYAGIDAWIRKWCAAHPAENIHAAVTEFLIESRTE